MTPERRAYLINACVEDCIESARFDPLWLEDTFRDGFPGFRNMSDDELEEAFADAGLDFLTPPA